MADPRAPTRKELARSFNGDQRMIRAFEKLFDLIPDDLNSLVLEIQDAVFNWVGPSIGQLNSQIAEIIKRHDQDIQFEDSDYDLLLNDSGVVADTDPGDLVFKMPDASNWKNEDKFVQNIGANTATMEGYEGQTISGVDVMLIESNRPHPIAYVKSDGANLIFLSDRFDSNVLGADFVIGDDGTEVIGDDGTRVVGIIG